MEFSVIWLTITPKRLCSVLTDMDMMITAMVMVTVTATLKMITLTIILKITHIATQPTHTVKMKPIATKVTTDLV